MSNKQERLLNKVNNVKKIGLYPYFQEINSEQGPIVQIGQNRVIMMGSNNYLGMTNNPLIKQAAKDAIDKYGVGSTGSRLLNGTIDLHNELESRLARFVGKEEAVSFSTGLMANNGAISSLIERNCWVLSDQQNHASIIDGIRMSRTSNEHKIVYNHCDMNDLEDKLKKIPIDDQKWIITDGIFSMEGDIAPLNQIVDLAEQYSARIYVDDAHAIGVIGENGRGTANYYNVTEKVDVIMGTFSKSFASIGGFIATKSDWCTYVRHTARSFIFSASSPPASLAVVLAVLDIVEKSDELQKKVLYNAEYLKKGLISAGFNVTNSKTAIVPIVIGNQFKLGKLWKLLINHKPLGVYTNPVIPPATALGHELLRMSVMATMTKVLLNDSIDILSKIGKKLHII